MATGNSSVTSDLLGNGFIRVLVFFALAVAPCSALCGFQAAGGSVTPLPPNAPALPTTIKNAPFSAQVATEYDRVLANGNHIHRDTHGRIFRDSQGRVRTETQVAGLYGVDSLEHIAIQDPILHEIIHLDPRSRTASVHHLGEPPAAVAEAPHSGIPTKSGRALLTTPETSTGGAAFAPPRQQVASQALTEPLGTRMIEGLPAIGTRTTRTTTDGQGDPIVAVSEVWYSRDLQMIVVSISDDGESGHSIMRVTNIVRGAPNEKLFRVPPDYTVKDGNPIAAVTKH
jgi:hypothetical protein